MYLKQNIAITPTVGQWYAWSFLISPMSAGHFFSRYIDILSSFISEPTYHYAAAIDPKTSSGPFVRYRTDDLPNIIELKEFLENQVKELLCWKESICRLYSLIEGHPIGYSMDNLYQEMPQNLRGKIELTYDLMDHPSFRIFESLLYHLFDHQKLQSVFLNEITSFQRAFTMSTPYLEGNHLCTKIPISFSDKMIDELCKIKYNNVGSNEVLEWFKTSYKIDISPYLTFEEPTLRYTAPDPEKTRVRYFGHASLLFEHDHTCVMSDPVLAYPNVGEGLDKYYSYFDLPNYIDCVIITHNHTDHFDFETLIQLRHKIRCIIVPRNNVGFLADPSMKLALLDAGFENVIEISLFETINIKNISISALPFLGEHGDLNIHSKISFLLKINGKQFLLAVDSNNIDTELYKHIHRKYGDIDTVYIGMESVGAPFGWAYGPLLHKKPKAINEQSRRLCGSNEKRAFELVNTIQAKEVYAYAMGLEPWLHHIIGTTFNEHSSQMADANGLVTACRASNRSAKILSFKDEFLY